MRVRLTGTSVRLLTRTSERTVMRRALICYCVMIASQASAAALPEPVYKGESQQIKAASPGIDYVGGGQKLRIDARHSAVVLQEYPPAEQPAEPKGRRYVLGLLDNRTHRLILTCERGDLNQGENSSVASATKTRAIFVLGTDYVQNRRVACTYDIESAKVLHTKQLPALPPGNIP